MGGLGTSVAMMLSEWDFHNELWAFGLIGVFLGVGFFLSARNLLDMQSGIRYSSKVNFPIVNSDNPLI